VMLAGATVRKRAIAWRALGSHGVTATVVVE